MSGRSTEVIPRPRKVDEGLASEGLILALDFREIQGASEGLAAQLGVKGQAAIAAKLRDVTFVEAQLRSLPGGALAALEALAEAGGAMPESGLASTLNARLGMTIGQTARATALAQVAGLAICVETSFVYTHKTMSQIALLSDCAPIVAARVRGVTLRRIEAPADLTPEPSHSLRDLVARVASTIHAAVKVTASGYPNRASLKKLAPKVGLEAEALGDLLDDVSRAGVLGAREGMLVPILDDLRALARGEIVLDPMERAFREHVDETRWTNGEHLARATPSTPSIQEAVTAQAVRSMPTLALAQHEGVTFVRRARFSPGGDGHVTPSFEVMLGPACDPELAATLALAAEPVRFDRVLTLKLGPASVAAACALGVSTDEILSALGKVGRHETPDNVRVMVADWAKSVRTATVRKAWVIEASSAEAADASARALGAKVVARPTATMLIVDESVGAPGATLVKAGIATGDRPERSHRFTESRRLSHGEPKPIAAWSPMAGLAERVQADRASGTLVPDLTDAPHEPTPADTVRRTGRNHVEGSNTRIFLDRVAKLWDAAEDGYADWAESLDEDACEVAKLLAVEVPLRLLPVIARTPKERRRLFESCDDAADLIRAAEQASPSGITLDGAFVVTMLNEHSEVGSFMVVEIARAMRKLGIDPGPLPAHFEGKPSLTGAAPRPVAPSTNGRPRPADLSEQPAPVVRKALDALALAQGTAWLRVRSKSQGERVVHMRVERLLSRGDETTVLGTDLDEELGRSFPIANVVAFASDVELATRK